MSINFAIMIGLIAGIITISTFFIIKIFFNPIKLSKIKTLIDGKRFSEAISLLKKYIEKRPDDPVAHYYLGLAYFYLKNYNLAKSEFNQLFKFNLINYDIDETEVRYKLAEIYLNNKQTDEALKELLLIYQKKPDDIDTCLRIADLFKLKGKWDHALGFYQKALKIKNTNLNAIYSIGEILYNKKQFATAKKYLQAACKIAPNSPEANYFYGLTLKELGDLRSATIYLSKATEHPKLGLNANFNLGLIYYKLKSFENAIKYLKNAYALVPDKKSKSALNILYLLADAYQNFNKIEEAIDIWEKIYAVNKSFKDVVIKLSNYQYLKNDDRIKEFIIAKNEDFMEICKNLIHHFGAKIIKIEFKDDGKYIEANAIGSPSGWKNMDKLPLLYIIYRDLNNPINSRLVEDALLKMRYAKAAKTFIIAPTIALPEVENLALSRPVEIIDRAKLSNLLKEIM